jgi:hypothetical protein
MLNRPIFIEKNMDIVFGIACVMILCQRRMRTELTVYSVLYTHCGPSPKKGVWELLHCVQNGFSCTQPYRYRLERIIRTCKALLNSISDIPSLGPASFSRIIVGLRIFNSAKIEHLPQRAIVSPEQSVCRVSMSAIETASFLFTGDAAGRPMFK